MLINANILFTSNFCFYNGFFILTTNPTNGKRHIQNKRSKHKTHHNYKHHSKLKHQKFNPHSKYKPNPKNTTGLAYRPRHTNNNTYHHINNWKSNSITNHIPISNAKLHSSPKQVKTNIPAIPNLFTTTKFTIIIYLETNMKKPKALHFNEYYFINKLELLKCGDIELNPEPMPNILHTHPATHKKRAKIYFIPNTIKLQHEYQHLASAFAPILKTYTHYTLRQSLPTRIYINTLGFSMFNNLWNCNA